MSDHKNTILAVVLSLLVIVGWQYFIGYPQVERQRQEAQLKEAQVKQQEQSQAQPGAAQPTPAQPNGAQPRDGLRAPTDVVVLVVGRDFLQPLVDLELGALGLEQLAGGAEEPCVV